MSIPEDPFMLLSFVNMKMRDGDYDSIGELCDALGCSESEIVDRLHEAGFVYNPELRQFR